MGTNIGNVRMTVESRRRLPDRVKILPQKGWGGWDWTWGGGKGKTIKSH